MRRWVYTAAVLAALAAIASAGAAAQASSSSSYVVVFRPGVAQVPATAAAIARANGGTVGFVYEHAVHGFSVRASAQGAAGIARNPKVAYVEADQLYTASAQEVPTGIERIFAAGNSNIGIDGTDDRRVDVDVAVIDTGIDLDHPDLNVVGSVNCASGGPFSQSCGSGGDDGNGHGSHVAGTIGAIDDGNGVVGVAPGARLWAVRVLNNNGSGYTSWVVAGMDWVAANAGTIEVANMSLGGGVSQAIDDAANGLANAGIALAVAAGNEHADMNNSSPARAAKALTVTALADFNGSPGGGASPTCRTDQDDTLADFSNWGTKTYEIAAPGVCILSTWKSGGYNTISGTSMASPHVAGALALLASKGFARNWTGVSGLYSTLQSNGNTNWVDDSGDNYKEKLLDVSNTSVFSPALVDGSGGGGGGGADSTPPAAPTGLGATAGNGSVSLDWADNSEPDLGGYNVYRSTTSGGSYIKLTSSAQLGSSYSDSNVTSGTTYYYVVTAVDTTGNESKVSNEASATPSGSTSGPTVTLSSSSTNNGSTWTASVIVTTSSGAAVTWQWSNGASGSGTCNTSSTSAPCTASMSGIPKKTGSVRFTVVTVGGGDSGQFIDVLKP
jgi:subtilisin family serine protease